MEQELIVLAARIRELRISAAADLQEAAGRHLRDLAFNDCGFEVRLNSLEATPDNDAAGNGVELKTIDASSLTRTGADSAEFLVRLNPGMPAAPLAKTASGGELSRIMLAIKSAVSTSRETASLVFDEIDAGIGGETGSAVGAKLKNLSREAQIICITHLPQIACHADAGFRVVKSSSAAETSTGVERLEGEAAIDELCRMMGSRPSDAKARAHAADLLKNAGNVVKA